mmetsp:Transcript_140644/g.449635  ORF Transcript_140644/g.449635 Transcript_140644/m.449635 type:complete len:169 (-) Transcript_140644:186-692(-)
MVRSASATGPLQPQDGWASDRRHLSPSSAPSRSLTSPSRSKPLQRKMSTPIRVASASLGSLPIAAGGAVGSVRAATQEPPRLSPPCPLGPAVSLALAPEGGASEGAWPPRVRSSGSSPGLALAAPPALASLPASGSSPSLAAAATAGGGEQSLHIYASVVLHQGCLTR